MAPPYGLMCRMTDSKTCEPQTAMASDDKVALADATDAAPDGWVFSSSLSPERLAEIRALIRRYKLFGLNLNRSWNTRRLPKLFKILGPSRFLFSRLHLLIPREHVDTWNTTTTSVCAARA